MLACGIRLNNGFDEILRYVLVVCKELFSVFWKAVTTVAKRWVVVMGTDTGVERDAVDDVFGVKAFGGGVCVELVKVGDAKS